MTVATLCPTGFYPTVDSLRRGDQIARIGGDVFPEPLLVLGTWSNDDATRLVTLSRYRTDGPLGRQAVGARIEKTYNVGVDADLLPPF